MSTDKSEELATVADLLCAKLRELCDEDGTLKVRFASAAVELAVAIEQLLTAQPGPVACEPLKPSRNVIAGMLREWRSRSSRTPYEMADELLKLLDAPQEAQPAPTDDPIPADWVSHGDCGLCKLPVMGPPNCGQNGQIWHRPCWEKYKAESAPTAPAKTATPALDDLKGFNLSPTGLESPGHGNKGQWLNREQVRATRRSPYRGIRIDAEYHRMDGQR